MADFPDELPKAAVLMRRVVKIARYTRILSTLGELVR